MSQLTVYADNSPDTPTLRTRDHGEIARVLAAVGVRLERWEAAVALAPGATQDEVIDAYRPQIERLMAEGGYATVDVARVTADHPQREALRQRFLAEHTHAEDEVRFFVEGSGLFCFHLGGSVYQLVAEAGDLVGVPAGARHWFDTGAAPCFTAIRLFLDPAGWVAQYTGDPIAARFPLYAP